MTDPQKDEHIEELLSKLQGIFGKLSHSEEEEKPQVPTPAPSPAAMPAPIPAPTAAPITPPPMPSPAPEPVPTSTPNPAPPAPTSIPVLVSTPIPAATPPPMVDPSMPLSGYESTVPLQDPEKLIVPTAIYYPQGRAAEAKTLAQKLETMTPKFTKVAFRLRVIVFTLYDAKSEWKDAIIAKGAEVHFQTVFVLMDRPLDDVKRKAIAAELEERGVYFQEVLTMSIEKKAFYTDVLLGLVFFFDSHKPKTDEQE